MLEDWPKWILLSEKGFDFCFIDKPLARYRVTNNSVCSGERHRAAFRESLALLYRYYKFKPSIRLFGLRPALFLYIKHMGRAIKTPFWRLMGYALTAKDRFLDYFHSKAS